MLIDEFMLIMHSKILSIVLKAACDGKQYWIS